MSDATANAANADNAEIQMTDIDITWNCPQQHCNNITYSFDILPGEDVDHIVDDFCSDISNQEEHRCHECDEIGFNNVSWEYNGDMLIEPNLLYESDEGLVELPPAA